MIESELTEEKTIIISTTTAGMLSHMASISHVTEGEVIERLVRSNIELAYSNKNKAPQGYSVEDGLSDLRDDFKERLDKVSERLDNLKFLLDDIDAFLGVSKPKSC